MKKKVILLDHEPWTIRRKQLFFDLFEKAGIRLNVWDLSQWLYPGLHIVGQIDEPYVTNVTDRKQFDSLLENESKENTVFIEELYRSWDNRHVQCDLYSRGFHTVKIDLYANSNLYRPSLLDKIKTIRVGKLVKYISKVICYKLNHVIPPTEFFSSSAISGRTKPINHPDYEKFKFGDHKRLVDSRYIVFCDVFFPLHPDLKYFYNSKHLPDVDKYRNILSNFFDNVEKKYNMPVVIAAHPKAEYGGTEFGGRKIIKYNTDNLVYFAEKVIIHVCNSISYSMLGNKEIAFVTTDDYLSLPHHRKAVKGWENILGLKSQNIERILPQDVVFYRIDPIIRHNYISTFLTSEETKDTPNYLTIRDSGIF